MDNATKYGHEFGEAFMLMTYLCEDCGLEEKIWNSRDGITPATEGCVFCGGFSSHVRWEEDIYSPSHQLKLGDRFFRDGTEGEAAGFLRQRVLKAPEYIPDGYTPEGYADELIKNLTSESHPHEFSPGWPILSVHVEVPK